MSPHAHPLRFRSVPFVAAFAVAIALLAGAAASSRAQTSSAAEPISHATEMSGGMAHMSGHMYMTTLRPKQPGDQAKADAIVAAAKAAMAPYEDYRNALADGYRIFLPNIPQPHVSLHESDQRTRGMERLRSTQADLTALSQDSRWRLQAHRRHVHRPRRCHRGRDQQPHPSQHRALASAHQFLQGARRDRRPPTSVPMRNSACSAPSIRRKLAMPPAVSFFPTSSAGWSTSIPTNPTRAKSGPSTTTMATTTWTTPPCPA